MHARDILIEALTVGPDCSVRDLAVLLLGRGLDGACVVDQHDELDQLVGVVTTMDLVFQEKQVHLPTILNFLDFAIPLEPPSRLRAELDKIAGTTVQEIMTREPVTVEPERLVSEVARMMVEQHLTIVPVVEDGKLLGMITKQALLRSVLG
jgi:CBS domain-containing protein